MLRLLPTLLLSAEPSLSPATLCIEMTSGSFTVEGCPRADLMDLRVLRANAEAPGERQVVNTATLDFRRKKMDLRDEATGQKTTYDPGYQLKELKRDKANFKLALAQFRKRQEAEARLEVIPGPYAKATAVDPDCLSLHWTRTDEGGTRTTESVCLKQQRPALVKQVLELIERVRAWNQAFAPLVLMGVPVPDARALALLKTGVHQDGYLVDSISVWIQFEGSPEAAEPSQRIKFRYFERAQ